jgi:hypothetical protein
MCVDSLLVRGVSLGVIMLAIAVTQCEVGHQTFMADEPLMAEKSDETQTSEKRKLCSVMTPTEQVILDVDFGDKDPVSELSLAAVDPQIHAVFSTQTTMVDVDGEPHDINIQFTRLSFREWAWHATVHTDGQSRSLVEGIVELTVDGRLAESWQSEKRLLLPGASKRQTVQFQFRSTTLRNDEMSLIRHAEVDGCIPSKPSTTFKHG